MSEPLTGQRAWGIPQAVLNSHPWMVPFLESLEEDYGTAARAARVAGIRRQTAYAARKTSAEFDAAWREIVESATDIIERNAAKLAANGQDEYALNKDGEAVLTRSVQYPPLIMGMLKHRRRDVYHIDDRTSLADLTGGKPLRRLVVEVDDDEPEADSE